MNQPIESTEHTTEAGLRHPKPDITLPAETQHVPTPTGSDWNEAAALAPRQIAYNDMLAMIRVHELDDFVKQRQEWSTVLKICIVFILVYVAGITVGVGRGWLVFQQAYLLQLIFASCFAALYGLVRILLRFLYAQPPQGS